MSGVNSVRCGCGAIIKLPNLKARAVTCDACHRARVDAVERALIEKTALYTTSKPTSDGRQLLVVTPMRIKPDDTLLFVEYPHGSPKPDLIAWDMQPEKPLTPAGKFHQVQSFLNHDPPLISREQAMELLSLPDLPEQSPYVGDHITQALHRAFPVDPATIARIRRAHPAGGGDDQ